MEQVNLRLTNLENDLKILTKKDVSTSLGICFQKAFGHPRAFWLMILTCHLIYLTMATYFIVMGFIDGFNSKTQEGFVKGNLQLLTITNFFMGFVMWCTGGLLFLKGLKCICGGNFQYRFAIKSSDFDLIFGCGAVVRIWSVFLYYNDFVDDLYLEVVMFYIMVGVLWTRYAFTFLLQNIDKVIE